MKPTSFEIPKCCTRVTIEQHEDKLVTIFELKDPKDEAEPINEKFVNISANCMGVEFNEQIEPEKKCIEELKPERWRAKKGCKYWFVSSSLNCLSTNDLFSLLDNIRYGVGNYFQTEQQANDFAKQIKQLPR